MNKLLAVLPLAVALLVGCQKYEEVSSGADGGVDNAVSRAAYTTTRGAELNVVHVKFRRGMEPKAALLSATGVLTGVERLDKVGSAFSAVSMERIFPYSAKHNAKHVRHGLDLWYEVRLAGGGDSPAALAAAVTAYGELSDVLEYVETSKPIGLIDDSPVVPVSDADIRRVSRSASRGPLLDLPFNDPMLVKQWNFDYVDEKASEGSGLGLFTAWEVSAGARDVIVAIVDGGVAYYHEDLQDNMWVNEAEMNGAEGVDDDGNGYVDDKRGWNFADNKKDVIAASHGTHVAGTVGAVSNNGVGVAGVAGGTGNGDGVRLMGCSIGDDSFIASGAKAAAAIIYGADNGAVISQNSWGYSFVDMREQVVEDAIDYFIKEAGNATDFPNSPMRGGVVFFAASNSGITGNVYPAAYEPVVAVAAANHRAARPSYSNYGTWVDISAQGGDNFDYERGILSTIPEKDGVSYGYKWGTSMACPHVSGVAALLVAANRGITAAELKSKVLASVRSLESTEPRDWKLMGSGLLDATVFLTPVNDNVAPAAIADLELVDGATGYSLQWTVPAERGNDRVAKYTVYYSEDEIDASSLSGETTGLKSFEVTKYKWLPVGAKISYDLAEAAGFDAASMAGTSYNFVIVAADRWGNSSGGSNVVEHSAMAADQMKVATSVVRGVLNVMWGKGFVGTKEVGVYDTAGRKVIGVTVPEADSKAEIVVAGLSSGNYVVKVVGAGGGQGSSKFRKL